MSDRGVEHYTWTVIQRSSIHDERAIEDHLSWPETSFEDLASASAALANVRTTIPLQDGDEWVLAEIERWWRPGASGLRAKVVE